MGVHSCPLLTWLFYPAGAGSPIGINASARMHSGGYDHKAFYSLLKFPVVKNQDCTNFQMNKFFGKSNTQKIVPESEKNFSGNYAGKVSADFASCLKQIQMNFEGAHTQKAFVSFKLRDNRLPSKKWNHHFTRFPLPIPPFELYSLLSIKILIIVEYSM